MGNLAVWWGRYRYLMANPLPPSMANRLEVWSVDRLKPYERNARTHTPEQVKQIQASIQEFGFTNPILVASDDGIIAGHGRLLAAKDMGLEKVPVIVLDHLTPAQRRAYILADNQLAMNAGWDMSMLQEEMLALNLEDFDVSLIGFNDSMLSDLLNPDVDFGEGYEERRGEGSDAEGDDDEDEEDGDEEGSSRSDGSLLELVNIAIDDPTHKPERGDVWMVGHHTLLICSVMTDWGTWTPLLENEATIFCPYPGPTAPLSEKAKTLTLIMVQPDQYIAGHLLDRYAEVNGKESVRKVAAA